MAFLLRIRCLVTVVLAVSLLGPVAAAQQVPQRISYQGTLTEADEAPVDGTVDLFFAFYASETGGQPIAQWTERYDDELVQNGRFNVALGSQSGGLPAALFDGRSELWLEVQVDDEALPRVYMTSTLFALQAQGVVDGAIDTPALADQAVTGAKLAEGTVVRSLNGLTGDVGVQGENGATVRVEGNTLFIQASGGNGDSGVQGIQNSDGALAIDGPDGGGTVTIDVRGEGITSTMLDDGAVTGAKIGDGAVGSEALADDAAVRSLQGQTGTVDLTSDDGTVAIDASDGVIDLSAPGDDGSGLTSVNTDGTLAGDGTADDVLGIAEGGVGIAQLAGGSVTAAKLETTNNPTEGQALHFDGSSLAWDDVAGGGGLTSVNTDGTLTGDGTEGNALGLANESVTAEKLAPATPSSADQVLGYDLGDGTLMWRSIGDGGGLTSVSTDGTLTGDGTEDNVLGLAGEGVGTEQLAASSVTASKLSTANTPSADQVLSFDGSSLVWSAGGGDGDGLTSVTTDGTLMGDGTAGDVLGIADDGVGPDQLAADAVTSDAIANAQITAVKLEPAPPDDDDTYVLAYEDGTMRWQEAEDIGDDGGGPPFGGEQPSARRFKEDVEPLDDPLALVEALRGVRYRWKENGAPDVGVIAEEVAEVLPELVTFEDDGQARGVHYAKLVAVLIEATKAQQAELDARTRTIERQRAELDALNHRMARLERLVEEVTEASTMPRTNRDR